MIVRWEDAVQEGQHLIGSQPKTESLSGLFKQITLMSDLSNEGMTFRFHLKMVDFIKQLFVSVYKKIGSDQFRSISESYKLDPYTMSHFYIELGIKLGLLGVQEECIEIIETSLFEQVHTGLEIIEAIEREDHLFLKQLKKPTELNFVFIYSAICYRNQKHFDSAYVQKQLDNEWKSFIDSKNWEYSLILSEYFLELLRIDLHHKIELSKDEIFYTDLGKYAFRYTYPEFKRTISSLHELSTITSCLDIGCGFGHYSKAVSDFTGASVVGLERQQEVSQKAQAMYKDSHKIRILNENVLDYKHEEPLDLIMLNYVLFYLSKEEQEQLFNRMAVMLGEKGKCMICHFFPGMEQIQMNVSIQNGDIDPVQQLAMHMGNVFLYAEVLLDDSLADFYGAERLDTLLDIANRFGLKPAYITNADPFYYSYFVVLEKG